MGTVLKMEAEKEKRRNSLHPLCTADFHPCSHLGLVADDNLDVAISQTCQIWPGILSLTQEITARAVLFHRLMEITIIIVDLPIGLR